ncbi:MAG TPA: IS4 family transposase [Thermoanaerobaculia bacterium]|nr:IS4 family transposase [Thermoanaerobaculia bacterium]
MHQQLFLEEDWSYLLSFLPPRKELERSAAAFGAIRRIREISSASTLLRLMMAYGFCGMSLRRTAAWAAEAGLANISDVSLLDRFRNGAEWLGHLLAVKLADHAAVTASSAAKLKVRLIDASSITRVGGRGTDWRLHMTMSLASLKIDDIAITDVSGGERLSRFKFHPQEIVVADAGYAHRAGLESVARDGADFLVRLNWSNLPLITIDGQPVDLLAYCRSVEGTTPAEFTVRVRGSNMAPVRLLIVRKTKAAAEESRQCKEKERGKKGTVDLRTLEATEYVMLLTSAPADKLTLEQAFELYRFRWQIELIFKRLKSIINLDEMPAKNTALAKVILLSKLLGALLVDDYTERYVSFSPWGYPITIDDPPAVSLAHR